MKWINRLAWIVVLGAFLLLGYWWGQSSARQDISKQYISNRFFVKDIAELAAVEVHGELSISRSNIDTNWGWMSSIKNSLLENTLTVNVPYTAKYGVEMGAEPELIQAKKNMVLISLPNVKLLSLELHLDQMQQYQKSGWLVNDSPEQMAMVQKHLYQQSRHQLEKDSVQMSRAEVRIQTILQHYFSLNQTQVQCYFGLAPGARPSFKN